MVGGIVTTIGAAVLHVRAGEQDPREVVEMTSTRSARLVRGRWPVG
jgi:hypothetical protein